MIERGGFQEQEEWKGFEPLCFSGCMPRSRIALLWHPPANSIRSLCCSQSGTAEELEANLEMSSLVNYIQPARFHSFDYAESESALSIMCASCVIGEHKRAHGHEFQLSRHLLCVCRGSTRHPSGRYGLVLIAFAARRVSIYRVKIYIRQKCWNISQGQRSRSDITKIVTVTSFSDQQFFFSKRYTNTDTQTYRQTDAAENIARIGVARIFSRHPQYNTCTQAKTATLTNRTLQPSPPKNFLKMLCLGEWT